MVTQMLFQQFQPGFSWLAEKADQQNPTENKKNQPNQPKTVDPNRS